MAAAIVDVAFRFVMISSPPVSHFGGVDLDSLPFRKQGQEAGPGSGARKLSLASAAVDKHSAVHIVESWTLTHTVWQPGCDVRGIYTSNAGSQGPRLAGRELSVWRGCSATPAVPRRSGHTGPPRLPSPRRQQC